MVYGSKSDEGSEKWGRGTNLDECDDSLRKTEYVRGRRWQDTGDILQNAEADLKAL